MKTNLEGALSRKKKQNRVCLFLLLVESLRNCPEVILKSKEKKRKQKPLVSSFMC